MKRSLIALAAGVVLPLCFTQPAAAEIPEEGIKASFEDGIFPMSGVPGMMIGIVSGDETAVISFGETAKGNGVAPSLDTVWAIGSVSKVFTSQILGAMVVSGEVKLTDPVEMYLPKGVKVPTFEGRAVTLLDLATHTAGLPRTIITEEEYEKAGDLANPAYDTDRAWKWLADNKLTHRPGTHMQYSNYGFGLLGQALALKRGVTYGELVEQYYGQFGMKDVTVAPTEAQMKRKATSYWMDGREINPDWPFNFEQPSGGIYASGHDMMAFLKLCLGQLDPPTQEANTMAHATYVYRTQLDNALTTSDSGMGLGWAVLHPNNGLPTLLHKNGWVSGFNTWVILAPTEDIAVFSMSNKPFLTMQSALEGVIRIVMASRDE